MDYWTTGANSYINYSTLGANSICLIFIRVCTFLEKILQSMPLMIYYFYYCKTEGFHNLATQKLFLLMAYS